MITIDDHEQAAEMAQYFHADILDSVVQEFSAPALLRMCLLRFAQMTPEQWEAMRQQFGEKGVREFRRAMEKEKARLSR